MARVSRRSRTGAVAAAGLPAGTTLIAGCGGQATGPEDKAGTEAERLRQRLGDSLPMHLWLEDRDRIRRQWFEVSLDSGAARSNSGSQDRSRSQPPSRKAPEAKVRTTVEFSDFGAGVEVSPPPAEKTEDVTGKLARQTDRSSNG